MRGRHYCIDSWPIATARRSADSFNSTLRWCGASASVPSGTPTTPRMHYRRRSSCCRRRLTASPLRNDFRLGCSAWQFDAAAKYGRQRPDGGRFSFDPFTIIRGKARTRVRISIGYSTRNSTGWLRTCVKPSYSVTSKADRTPRPHVCWVARRARWVAGCERRPDYCVLDSAVEGWHRMRPWRGC